MLEHHGPWKPRPAGRGEESSRSGPRQVPCGSRPGILHPKTGTGIIALPKTGWLGWLKRGSSCGAFRSVPGSLSEDKPFLSWRNIDPDGPSKTNWFLYLRDVSLPWFVGWFWPTGCNLLKPGSISAGLMTRFLEMSCSRLCRTWLIPWASQTYNYTCRTLRFS